ncbi:MAG: hypothetical protein H0W83_17180, partial [Planctomycetes bacterium]|nr:hypothetical protein [Planctomycetota bacterium]
MAQRTTELPGQLESAQAEAAQLLGGCKRLLVMTGAGMSADAGIPTFRCDGGLWKNNRVE